MASLEKLRVSIRRFGFRLRLDGLDEPTNPTVGLYSTLLYSTLFYSTLLPPIQRRKSFLCAPTKMHSLEAEALTT